MKSSFLFLFANAVSSFVAGNINTNKSYNIYYKSNDSDLDSSLKLPPEHNYRELMRTSEHTWANVNLNTSEVNNYTSWLQKNGGMIKEDGVAYFIDTPADSAYGGNIEEYDAEADADNEEHNTLDEYDDNDAYEADEENSDAAATEPRRLRAKKKKKRSPYINAVPKCNAWIKGNVEFFVMDTYLNPRSKANRAVFKNVRVTYAETGIAHSGCNPHSAYVSAIMVGNNYGVIQRGSRNIYNIPVFTCGGSTNSSALYKGIGLAINRAKENTAKGIRSVLNWSLSGGGNDPILYKAIQEAVKYMYFGVSSGNEGANVCGIPRTPWNVPGVSITGGTVYRGNNLAWFSNYGVCVQMYLPSDYRMFNRKPDEGTSFASPIKVALVGIYADRNPKLTNQELDKAVNNQGTIVRTTKAPYAGQNITVLTKAKACPSI